jgi:hypothetical protein
MSLEQGLDALRRFSRLAVRKTKTAITEVKKAAGLPAGGPVSESNPRYYLVVAEQGAMVRLAQELDSPEVGGLRKGEVVTVVEMCGRRGRIADPLDGWISLETHQGEKIVRQTFPPDKKTQVKAMERRFERLKQQQTSAAAAETGRGEFSPNILPAVKFEIGSPVGAAVPRLDAPPSQLSCFV